MKPSQAKYQRYIDYSGLASQMVDYAKPDARWTKQAECLNAVDANIFFPVSSDANEQLALAYCQVCKVKTECLATALEDPFQSGIWGGMLESERNRLRKRMSQIKLARSRRQYRHAIAGK